jgi:formiminoglutamase
MEITQSAYLDTEAPPFAYSESKTAGLRPHLKVILETLERTAEELVHG